VLKGRCACRAVTYEVADQFVVAYNCHCSNCRAITGSAFLPWGEIGPEKLRVTKGEDSLIFGWRSERTSCEALWELLLAAVLDRL
jgi:hypothetical protein